VQQLRNFLKGHFKSVVVLTTLAVSVLAYALGCRYILIPAAIALSVLYVPTPKLFHSIVSRVIFALLLVLSLLQIAATLLFLVLPSAGFVALAVFTAVLLAILLHIIPTRRPAPTRWVSRADVASLLVIAFFMLPFTPIFAGQDSVRKIAEIGGIQAIDATNHYATLSEATYAEHFTYKPGYYYPRGFHLATGFIQNTVFDRQYDLGWRGNTALYFAQYLILGAAVAYLTYYFCLSLILLLRAKLDGFWQYCVVALCVGPMLALLYLIPFVNEGFLNYYYVCATVLMGALFLFELKDREVSEATEWRTILQDDARRWQLVAYLLLVFGASVSWPLLVPPLVLIGVWCIVPPNLNLVALVRQLLTPRALLLWFAFLIQLIPIYFQLKYTVSDSTQGINLFGGLRVFHGLILLAGLGILVGLVVRPQADTAQKRALLTVFVPFFAFVGLLVVMQYFMTGEIRYYVIKSALLLEILLLGLGVAGLFYVYQQRGLPSAKYLLLLPVVPLIALPLLLSTTPNPFKGSRDLLRDYSHEAKPPFFDQDVQTYARLGSEGKIAHFNSTALHYGQEQQKFFAHMQIAFWSNMMQYDASEGDYEALHCIGAVYSNLNFGTYSDKEQQEAITLIKKCATMAHERGETFYLITDADSAPLIYKTFGDLVTIVY